MLHRKITMKLLHKDMRCTSYRYRLSKTWIWKSVIQIGCIKYSVNAQIVGKQSVVVYVVLSVAIHKLVASWNIPIPGGGGGGGGIERISVKIYNRRNKFRRNGIKDWLFYFIIVIIVIGNVKA